jgi:hypothetical protein
MVISADFEKQRQYLDQENIASSILLYLFIAILLVKIAHLMRTLELTFQIIILEDSDEPKLDRFHDSGR